MLTMQVYYEYLLILVTLCNLTYFPHIVMVSSISALCKDCIMQVIIAVLELLLQLLLRKPQLGNFVAIISKKVCVQ